MRYFQQQNEILRLEWNETNLKNTFYFASVVSAIADVIVPKGDEAYAVAIVSPKSDM